MDDDRDADATGSGGKAARWRSLLRVRRPVLQAVTLALIFGAIWGLRGEPPFPLPLRGDEESPDFFTLGPTGNVRGRGPGLGQTAPDFALENADGDIVRLSDFRGNTVVLNFWATWCGPCRKEFPELVKLDAESADLVVVGVNLQENASQVREFADEFGAQFPIVVDADGKVAESYRVLGLPSTYFVDAMGILREQHFGQLSASIIAEKVSATSAANSALLP